MMPLIVKELTQEKIRSIRRRVESQDSVFLDKKYLDSMFLPSEIIGREEEAEHLIQYIGSLEKGFLTSSISVCGRSGSGKSTVIKLVCKNLSDIISTRFVNLREARTVFGCANLILSELGLDELKSAEGLNKAVESIEKGIEQILAEEGKKFFVLVLDEYDVIFNDPRVRPSDFVQKLLTIEENLREKDLWLCLITISNHALLDHDLDDRVKSRIGNSVVFFNPYKQGEVFNILRDRAAKAFVNKVDDSVLKYCSEICSDDSGDARRAIDLLRLAAELCDGKTITNLDVEKASEQIQRDRVALVLSNATITFKRVFVGLARITFLTDKKWHTTSTVHKQYCKILSKDVKPLSYRRIFDILKELEQAGLAVSKTGSKGRYGYNTEYMLTVPPETVKMLKPKMWEGWVKKKEKRYEMLHNPKFSGKDARSRYNWYDAEKFWREYVGLD